RSGPLDQYAKQRHRTYTQRDRFGVPKQGLALHIEAKRTECVNGRHRPALRFGKLSETLRASLTTYRAPRAKLPREGFHAVLLGGAAQVLKVSRARKIDLCWTSLTLSFSSGALGLKAPT